MKKVRELSTQDVAEYCKKRNNECLTCPYVVFKTDMESRHGFKSSKVCLRDIVLFLDRKDPLNSSKKVREMTEEEIMANFCEGNSCIPGHCKHKFVEVIIKASNELKTGVSGELHCNDSYSFCPVNIVPVLDKEVDL